MKYLNFTIIFLMFLSSCIFSGTPQVPQELNHSADVQDTSSSIYSRDTITVDTVIGDFKIFYRVSDVFDEELVLLGSKEGRLDQDMFRMGKQILLNIQKKDTTSIIAYQMIDIDDFECVISNVRDEGYIIDTFYLKEVAQNSVIFGAKLCMFGKDMCTDVEVFIDTNGTMKCFLLS